MEKIKEIFTTKSSLEKECAEIIEKYLHFQCSMGDLLVLAKKLYQLDHKANGGPKCPAVRIEKMEEGTDGIYYPDRQVIALSYDMLQRVLADPSKFVEFLDTVGHEVRHHEQNLARIEAASDPDYRPTDQEAQEELDNNCQVDDEDVDAMLHFLSLSKNDTLVSYVNGLSPEARKQFVGTASFSYYFQKKDEEDARWAAKDFIRRIGVTLANSRHCSPETRAFLMAQVQKVPELSEKELRSKSVYATARDVQASLDTLDPTDISRIEKRIVNFGLAHPDEMSQRDAFNKRQTFMKLVHLIFEKRPIDELEHVFLFNLENGSVAANNVIAKILNARLDPEQKASFGRLVGRFLAQTDCSCTTFSHEGIECVSSLMSNDQLSDLATDLIKKDKLRLAHDVAMKVLDRAIAEDRREFASTNEPRLSETFLSSRLVKPVANKVESLLHLPVTSTVICGRRYTKAAQKLYPAFLDYGERMVDSFKHYGPVLPDDHRFIMSCLGSILDGQGPSFMYLGPENLTDYGYEKTQTCLRELDKFSFVSGNTTSPDYFAKVYGKRYVNSISERRLVQHLSDESIGI